MRWINISGIDLENPASNGIDIRRYAAGGAVEYITVSGANIDDPLNYGAYLSGTVNDILLRGVRVYGAGLYSFANTASDGTGVRIYESLSVSPVEGDLTGTCDIEGIND